MFATPFMASLVDQNAEAPFLLSEGASVQIVSSRCSNDLLIDYSGPYQSAGSLFFMALSTILLLKEYFYDSLMGIV